VEYRVYVRSHSLYNETSNFTSTDYYFVSHVGLRSWHIALIVLVAAVFAVLICLGAATVGRNIYHRWIVFKKGPDIYVPDDEGLEIAPFDTLSHHNNNCSYAELPVHAAGHSTGVEESRPLQHGNGPGSDGPPHTAALIPPTENSDVSDDETVIDPPIQSYTQVVKADTGTYIPNYIQSSDVIHSNGNGSEPTTGDYATQSALNT
jgi:hypothetical protein